MYRKGIFQVLIGLAGVASLPFAGAQSGPHGQGIQCPSCQVGYLTEDEPADAIGDVIDAGLTRVTVMAGEAPGTFWVVLPDGRNYSVAPVGPVFRHQNTVERRLQQTEEGGIHLRSRGSPLPHGVSS